MSDRTSADDGAVADDEVGPPPLRQPVVLEADRARRVVRRHAQHLGLAVRRPELRDVRQQVADLQHVGLAKRRERVAHVVRRERHVDARVAQQVHRRHAAALVALVAAPAEVTSVAGSVTMLTRRRAGAR